MAEKHLDQRDAELLEALGFGFLMVFGFFGLKGVCFLVCLVCCFGMFDVCFVVLC